MRCDANFERGSTGRHDASGRNMSAARECTRGGGRRAVASTEGGREDTARAGWVGVLRQTERDTCGARVGRVSGEVHSVWRGEYWRSMEVIARVSTR